jgi:hypothetical protein
MARKMLMIAATAATLVTAVAPVTAMAQDGYGDGYGGYSRQNEHRGREHNSYDRYSDRRWERIAHERHERREQEQARRRYWQRALGTPE